MPYLCGFLGLSFFIDQRKGKIFAQIHSEILIILNTTYYWEVVRDRVFLLLYIAWDNMEYFTDLKNKLVIAGHF